MKKFPSSEKNVFKIFKKLDNPRKVQDYINKIPWNFETKGDTLKSPLEVIRSKHAHCIEGALLAASILWYHGHKPLILDLKTIDYDDDSHVVTLFQEQGLWGAISKTNHVILRYRDAVYKNPRELAMSYFNEYFLDDGQKTLRSYSAPFDLSRLEDGWLSAKKDLWVIDALLDKSPHFKIVPKNVSKKLRPTDAIERKILKFTQWKRKG